MHADRPTTRPRVDLLGTGLVTGGRFALVFGFSRAEVAGWGATITWSILCASAVLLVTFFGWKTRASASVMPLRIFADRDRAASLMALLLANTGIQAAFLVLTYYLQLTLEYSPVETDLAFLPLIGGVVTGSMLALSVFPRFVGPRVSIPFGMLVAAANLVVEPSQLWAAKWSGPGSAAAAGAADAASHSTVAPTAGATRVMVADRMIVPPQSVVLGFGDTLAVGAFRALSRTARASSTGWSR